MSQSNKARAGAGRPAGSDSEQVRQDLLQAARNLFLTNEFKAVSIRQIAEAAGVNGAMVNYYFGSKLGLYLTMVDELLELLKVQLEKMDKNGNLSIADFSSQYCQILVSNPWWPNFMVREVLFSDGEIRTAMVAKMSKLFMPKLLQSIRAEIDGGRFRSDLDPALTLLSVMGMTIFPFLAKPLTEQALQFTLNAKFAERLAAHNTTLFLHGVSTESNAATPEKTP